MIACGGTAGHIFPGLALAEELRKEDENCQIVIVVSTHPRDQQYLRTNSLFNDVPIKTVESCAFPEKLSLKSISFALKLIWGSLQSFGIILKYRPQVAIGFGGYASFAPLVAARLSGIPAFIHEQNLVPGKANQFLSRIVNKIAISFEDTTKFFPKGAAFSRKIVRTGLPLRKHILDCRQSQGPRQKDKFTILVFGGSQGAHKINQLVLSCLSQTSAEKRAQLQLIHLSGKEDFHQVKEKYKALGVNSRVFAFLQEIGNAYRVADLLIARSGASTIFEAATFGLPSILIPYPYGSRHQKENAFHLKHNGAALVLDEEGATGKDLKKMLSMLLTDKGLREKLSEKIKLLGTLQASHSLKEEIDVFARGK
jgi:UDP-N-acetylglucosamine--N-acetylmuramyl-(pentapeptide) pyrophosphoryl-undecaprenol N-acetylglucosamine transferase